MNVTANNLFKATITKGQEDTARQRLYTQAVADMLTDVDTYQMADNVLVATYLLIDGMPKSSDEEKKTRNSAKSTMASQLRRAAKELEMEQSLRVRVVDGKPLLQYYTPKQKVNPLQAAFSEFKKVPSDENFAALVYQMEQCQLEAKKVAAEEHDKILEQQAKIAARLQDNVAIRESLKVSEAA
jgi:hypothetical protein